MQEINERLLFTPNAVGDVSVCLAYPNTYRVGMGSLGYQAVYALLATTPGVVCERAFALSDSGGRVLTVESGRSPGDFDILAFSLSFEADYPNIVRMLDQLGIPARAADRRASGRRWPLLLAGGPAVFLNPEPIAPFFDAFLIGEGEEMITEAFASARTWPARGFDGMMEDFASVAGAYLPDLYTPHYDDEGALVRIDRQAGAPERVERRYIETLDKYPTSTTVASPDAVFGDYFLVEASRGCEWGCRFCAAGYMYRPVRHRSAESLTTQAVGGLAQSDTIGLVGAEMASQPGIATTCMAVAGAGGRASPSSLKADQITPQLAAAVAGSGTRSVTVAPEAGSERMRRIINKNLTEAEILRAADLMVGDGVESLKLYFMCSLPYERDEDVDGIVDLTDKIRGRLLAHGRSRGRVGRIKVSLNPFVPKPWTPFQWEPMETVSVSQRKIKGLRKRLTTLGGVDVDADSPREAYLQTLLSRGDRRVADVIEALARDPEGWWSILRKLQAAAKDGVAAAGSIDPNRFVYREYPTAELLPWDFIDHHIDKSYLVLERRRALAERETEPCDVATCRTCGAC